MESIEIQVVYTSETLGLFEALMYVVVDDWIFIGTLNAYVVPNIYDLEPIYLTDVAANEKVELPLFITNPLPSDTLLIEELYSTE